MVFVGSFYLRISKYRQLTYFSYFVNHQTVVLDFVVVVVVLIAAAAPDLGNKFAK